MRPGGPGWGPVRASLGLEADTAAGDPLPLALVGWALGCTMVWSALLTIGQALYGQWALAAALGVTAVVSGTALALLSRRLWPDTESSAAVPGGSPR